MVSLFFGREHIGMKASASRGTSRLVRHRREADPTDVGIEINVDGRAYRFGNSRELDQFLRSRRQPRRRALEALDADQQHARRLGLRRQLALLEQLGKDLEADRAAALEQLRSLDRRVFTKEHDWRVLWGQLLGAEDVPVWSITSMLRHYVGYLRNRIAEGVEQPGSGENAEALRQTAFLDRGMITGLSVVAGQTVPLPAGEVMVFDLPIGAGLDMYLATRPFRFCHDSAGYQLLDRGSDAPGLLRSPVYRLREGRYLIGRSPDCDLRVLPRYRDVSRVHLLIELAGLTVRMTDLSAHGTHLSASAWSLQLHSSANFGRRAAATVSRQGAADRASPDSGLPGTLR